MNNSQITVHFDPAAPAPGLYMDQKKWKLLPQLLTDPFFSKLFDKARKSLDDFIEQLRTRPPQKMGLRVIKQVIQLSCVAWRMTGEERYLHLAVETLREACGRDWTPDLNKPWVKGLRGSDLNTAEYMYLVAFCFDALHDELSPDDRRMCVESLAYKGLTSYLKGIELNDWWARCDFNWNSMQHGNAGIAALAVRRHAPEIAERVISEAQKGLKYMTDAFYEGGGWTEGTMYFGTAIGHLTDFAFALQRAGGGDCGVLANKRMHDTIDFALWMHGGDGREFNFSDMPEFKSGWAMSQVFWYARQLDRPDWTAEMEENLLARGFNMLALFSGIDSFWYRMKDQPSRKGPARKGLRHFKGIDWAVWRGEKSWCAFRGGYNGGNHNNHDLGHFIYGLGQARFLIDPGYGLARADMHNTPLIRFRDQTDCATAPIIKCESLECGFYLICDLRQAFPFALEYFDRHLVMLGDRYLFMVDDVKGRGDIRNDIQENLQTHFPVLETAEGFSINSGESILRVCLGGDVGGKKLENWEDRSVKATRILWHDSYFRVRSIQPVAFIPDDSPVSFQTGQNEVSVSIGGIKYSVLLRQAWNGENPLSCRIEKTS